MKLVAQVTLAPAA